MKIGLDELADLSAGAVLLATGGGGDPYVSLLATQEVLKQTGPVNVVSVNELADDAYVVAIGGVGAPTVSLELLPSVQDAAKTLDLFEKHVGRTVDAVVSFEIGGGNSLIPIMAAAAKGIPVVDGDGMGRALPEAQMMTFPIAGVAPTPAVALDYAGNSVTFKTSDTITYERHVRSMALAMGGMILTAEHPMNGLELKNSIVPDTLSFSIELGAVLRQYRGETAHMVPRLQALFRKSIYGDLFPLFDGKVIDYQSQVIGGFDIGEALIEPFDQSQERVRIRIKNEYLAVWWGPRLLASVPDLISILDYETSAPINAERLKYGQRVTVVGVGCPRFYRTERALSVVGPRSFGFDFDFVPIELLLDKD